MSSQKQIPSFTPEEEAITKKPLFKNLTTSLSNLVVKDKAKMQKSGGSETKPGKKKWFGRRKVEPLLS